MSVFRKLMKRYETRSSNPFFDGGAVGYLTYEMADSFESICFRKKEGWNGPRLCFGFHRELIVYDHAREIYFLVVNVPENQLESASETFRQLKKNFADVSEQDVEHFFSLDKSAKLKPVISKNHFVQMVETAKDYIAAGDIYQANLSQRFNFDFEGSPLKLYEDLRAINPSPFSSFFKWDGLQVISSSPERLVSKRGRVVETRPIAGTRPVSPSGKGDEQNVLAGERLLANAKERAEHIMLVDLERNDLGRVCDFESVQVEELMALEKYSHVIHIVSKIVGYLSEGKDMFDLIETMFPGGTITGCPKVRCMEIIDELEPLARGLYTGSIGYLGFNGNMDLNIVIRTIVLERARGHLQVGAGIVHDSMPEKEYQETLHKGEALVQALSGVRLS